MKTKTEIIKEYEYIVVRIASQYERVGEPMEDMLQDGRIGLLWAAEHYQEVWQQSFESYAEACVRHEISKALREHGYTVKVPRRVAEETDHHPVIGLEACKEVASEESEGDIRYERLYTAIDQLTKKQREVILNLYGLEGRKRKRVKSVAREMRMTVQAIYGLQERSVTQLQITLLKKKA